MRLTYLSPKHDIRFVAAILSIIFTLLVLAHQQPSNGDAIVYIKAAQAFGQDGLLASIKTYQWPFFSILLYSIASILPLSLLNAGILLNNVLVIILILSFISIIKALGGNYRAQCIAAVVILLFPYLNHFRDNVLRDMGYYAFAMASLYYLLRCRQGCTWRRAVSWNICILLAFLFRIEGIAFAVLAPFALLSDRSLCLWPRTLAILRCYAIPIAWLVLIILYAFFTGKLNLITESRMNEIFFQLQSGFSNTFNHLQGATAAVKTHVLNYYGQHDAIVFVLWGLIGIFFAKLISTLGLVYSILSCHGQQRRHFSINAADKAIFYTFVGLNLIICFLFLSQMLFLSTRYITFLSLILLIPVVFSVNALIQAISFQMPALTKKRWAIALLSLGLFYNLIAGLGHFGTSKTYIIDAGKWIAHNTPSDARVYTNASQAFIYTNRVGTVQWNQDVFLDELLKNQQHINYIIILAGRNDESLENDLQTRLPAKKIKTFENKKGDKAYIYKVHQP